MEEELECPECPPAAPAWLATFADLMSLLMCFFVLLLTFSEMDAMKFKRLAGSMREAYGVQREIFATDPPKGTSVIAQHFSPSIPKPTPINEIKQTTTDLNKMSLEVLCQDEITQQEEAQGDTGQRTREIVLPSSSSDAQKVKQDAMEISSKLEKEIANGQVEIETVGMKIIIRISQEGSFRSGSNYIEDKFLPVIDRIRALLVTIPGKISVEGHTDSQPYTGGQYRSNWGLSSARAAAFAEELFVAPELSEDRFQIVGHGDKKPLVANDTPQGRAKNRRVELIIIRSRSDDTDNNAEIKLDKKKLDEAVNSKPEDFSITPDEVF